MINQKFLYPSWVEIEGACRDLYKQMLKNDYHPDFIIGLMKGGVVPARLFADYFNVRFDFYTMNVSLYKGINTKEDQLTIKNFDVDLKDKKVLILDDIWDSGQTMQGVLEYLKPHKPITATLYWRQKAVKKPDYYDTIVIDEWVVFPWETHEFERIR